MNFSQSVPACLHFMSRLRRHRLSPVMGQSRAYLSDVGKSAGRAAAAAREKEREEVMRALLHYGGQVINQVNYGATTVSNSRRGNEMIRGRSQLNTERVNEIINYLVIYSGAAPPPPHISRLLKPPTTESVCFN